MKKSKDLEVVSLMIKKYCRGVHRCKDGLCRECSDLFEYVQLRRNKCPYKDDKPFCSNCKIHCYKPENAAKIRSVMRYSGPRIVFSHPIIATKHLFATIFKKRDGKEENLLN